MEKRFTSSIALASSLSSAARELPREITDKKPVITDKRRSVFIKNPLSACKSSWSTNSLHPNRPHLGRVKRTCRERDFGRGESKGQQPVVAARPWLPQAIAIDVPSPACGVKEREKGGKPCWFLGKDLKSSAPTGA
jgi:hypothetical protein